MAQNMPASRPPSAPLTGWKVTDQVQTTEADPRGGAARGYRIHFTTGKGVASSVFVSEARYNASNVRAAVAAQAAVIDEVHGLQG